MLYIQVKYANILCSRMPLGKVKNGYVWNFKCPLCGDSKKHLLKTRGYIYRKNQNLFYSCKNCNVSCSLATLLKEVSLDLYNEYIFEKYIPKKESQIINESEEFRYDNFYTHLICLDKLNNGHPIIDYVQKRKIPSDKYSLLYVAYKHKRFINSVLPNKIKNINDYPRLVIPFLDEHKEVFAFQCRAFGNEEPKYLTLKLKENTDKIFGLDRLDKSKEILVVEGAIDSLFLTNCIAVSGSSFNIPTIKKLKDNCILILDNEPRNKEICKQMEKYINDYRICILPNLGGKDINDYILNGYSSLEIEKIIKENTYSGLEAMLRFNEWKRVKL